MTANAYDIAIVGAGLNGLVAAAYLGKSGRRVVVFEKESSVGGTMSTVEFASGYRSPATLDSIDLVHPTVILDLDLLSHGLQTIQGSGTTLLTTEGSPVRLLDHLEPKLDTAETHSVTALSDFLHTLGGVLEPALTKPLSDPQNDGLSGALDLFRLGWALRKLGKTDMPEALRFLPMSIKDVLDERFADESIKTLLAASALRGAWLGPRSAGGAYGLLHHNPPYAGGISGPANHAIGGPGALAESIRSFAESVGVEFRVSTRVEAIIIDDKTCKGVRLETGEEIDAANVISALDPHTTFNSLTGTEWLDPEFVEKVNQIRSNACVSVLKLGLDRLPEFKRIEQYPDALSGRIVVADSLDYIERAFDAAKYGELPEHPVLYVALPSVLDPSMAPDGHHVMHVWIQYTPHTLRGRSWDDQKNEFGDRVISILEAHAPGLAASVVHRRLDTPPDLERKYGLRHGCIYHADLTLDQLLYMRPIPGWFKYDTPINGLYLCGAGSHPGGAGTGLPGMCAAKSLA